MSLQDCSGHGQCTFSGCECIDGHHGEFCQAPPECPGVLDKSNSCCQSGLINRNGECCDERETVLDRNGDCCENGKVDKCGVCNGEGTTIDIMVGSNQCIKTSRVGT